MGDEPQDGRLSDGGGRGDASHDGDVWGPERAKSITWHDPMATAAKAATLNGLDFLRAIQDGTFPPPPIARLMGFRMVEVELGLAVFECTPDESVYNPIGLVHGGLVCTLSDSAAGCAVQSSLEAGVAYTSIDINVTYLRPVTKNSGVIRAVGRLTKPGRRVAYATVETTDASGRLLAHATSACLIMDNRPGAATAAPG